MLQVMCKDSEKKVDGEEEPGETKVSVKLFDSPSMNFTVPGEIPWNDPKFSEVVAQEALDRYKETSVWVSERTAAGRKSSIKGLFKNVRKRTRIQKDWFLLISFFLTQHCYFDLLWHWFNALRDS